MADHDVNHGSIERYRGNTSTRVKSARRLYHLDAVKNSIDDECRYSKNPRDPGKLAN
jgi:hypothetical protein